MEIISRHLGFLSSSSWMDEFLDPEKICINAKHRFFAQSALAIFGPILAPKIDFWTIFEPRNRVF
jgi:hypothetical protein